MPHVIFPEEVIAFIWDFDNTLIPGNMQRPIFDEYEIDETEFWKEVNGLASYYEARDVQVSPDTLYLGHILTYVKERKFGGLTNLKLKELGQKLEFFPGLPAFFPIVVREIEEQDDFKRHRIRVEHYVVSTGLRQMILGSAIADHVTEVWACEFVEEPAPGGYLKGRQRVMPMQVVGRRPSVTKRGEAVREISQVVYQLDNTTKTRAIFEINKGTNKDPRIKVNDTIALEDRRVPFENMIYIADGPSDIPVYSILNHSQGTTYAVYGESENAFEQAYDLQLQNRVQATGPADYREGSATYRWLMHSAKRIAERIVKDRDSLVSHRVHSAPHHLSTSDEQAVVIAASEPAVQASEGAVPQLVAKRGSKARGSPREVK